MIRIYARCNACKHVVLPPEVNEYSRPTCLVYPNGISIDEALKERKGNTHAAPLDMVLRIENIPSAEAPPFGEVRQS